VLKEFDHKHLNLDTPYFKTRIPTTENIAHVLWSVLAARSEIGELEKIRLFEEEDLYAEITRDVVVQGAASITRRYRFSSAHRVHSERFTEAENQRLYGKCYSSSIHGHNYELWVTVGGPIDSGTGMVTDLSTLDRVVTDRVLARFDGRNLNDDSLFSKELPTGENLSRSIWDLLVDQIPSGRLENIGVAETAESFCEYGGSG
jgi:6-pyruvoyltetrahydropterin/6-carboxytetrahydropterin synthase